jgi:hypothetical protein
MLKKFVLTAAAAAAVSVPLAGAAWAVPDNDPNNPPGKGGEPAEAGAFADGFGANPNGDGEPITPGSIFRGLAKNKAPGAKMPDVYGDVIDAGVAPLLGYPEWEGPTPPGHGVKTFTPGCSSGRHLNQTGGTGGGDGVCS